MKYLKVWTDFLPCLDTLTEAEIGRLFVSMLKYAETGEEPEEFAGNERFLWAVAKRDIDVSAARDEVYRENGTKGGRPKTKDNQTKPNETKRNQTEPNESKPNLQDKTRQDITGQDIGITGQDNARARGFVPDDEAAGITAEQNLVIDAAEDAGFKMSNDVRASLTALYADNGLQKMIDGLKQCSEYGAPTLAYLKAVLTGKPKRAAPAASVPAQQYGQRNNTNANDAAMENMRRMIRESRGEAV